jgi:hypothetical protein
MAVHIGKLTSTVRLPGGEELSREQLAELATLVAQRLADTKRPGEDDGSLYRSALPPLRVS